MLKDVCNTLFSKTSKQTSALLLLLSTYGGFLSLARRRNLAATHETLPARKRRFATFPLVGVFVHPRDWSFGCNYRWKRKPDDRTSE